jgi:REP element-mobilizing transposase RayT
MASGAQCELAFKRRGGKRKGAGRKPKGWRASEPHVARAKFSKRTPVHVTLRLIEGYPNLRTRIAYFALVAATRAVAERSDFAIIQISVEKDHIHLLCEADNDVALERGVRAFEIAAAQRLNRAFSKETGIRRRGRVFADRYHARLITNPTQARNSLAYVLCNWRHHDEDESSFDVRFWDIDYFSSGLDFDGWAELATGHRFRHPIPRDMRLFVKKPETWMLRRGWQLAGTISMYDAPGPKKRNPKPKRAKATHAR